MCIVCGSKTQQLFVHQYILFRCDSNLLVCSWICVCVQYYKATGKLQQLNRVNSELTQNKVTCLRFLKVRIGDSGETSKSKIDFESIQPKKIPASSFGPQKSLLQRALPDCWSTGPCGRESSMLGSRALIAFIANHIQLVKHTNKLHPTFLFLKRPIQSQYRVT